jgi:hypothetical protein
MNRGSARGSGEAASRAVRIADLVVRRLIRFTVRLRSETYPNLEECEVTKPQRLLVGALVALAGSMFGVSSAHAEPLTPLAPGEAQYLEQIRRVLSAVNDPVAFRSDGELLNQGQFVCFQASKNIVGSPVTLISPVVNQLAVVYLCPQYRQALPHGPST